MWDNAEMVVCGIIICSSKTVWVSLNVLVHVVCLLTFSGNDSACTNALGKVSVSVVQYYTN